MTDPDLLTCAGYRNVANCTESEQRVMLQSDDPDPRVRVWAAWSLGLRLSERFAVEARQTIANEPVAGVRRHLLVMLAGYGEVDIVAALARHDPDTYVRSTAARYVGELTARFEDAFVIASQLLVDDDERIRAAIIAGLPAVVPADVAALLSAARNDRSPVVREAVTRRAISNDDLELVAQSAFCESHLPVRWLALRALVDRQGPAIVFSDLSSARTRQAIDDLKAFSVSFAFEELADLPPGPAFLPVLDLQQLGVLGRIWLLGQHGEPVRDFLVSVKGAYAAIDKIVDPQEVLVADEFLGKLTNSLLIDPDLNAAEAGSLTPWGAWGGLDADLYEVIALLQTKLA